MAPSLGRGRKLQGRRRESRSRRFPHLLPRFNVVRRQKCDENQKWAERSNEIIILALLRGSLYLSLVKLLPPLLSLLSIREGGEGRRIDGIKIFRIRDGSTKGKLRCYPVVIEAFVWIGFYIDLQESSQGASGWEQVIRCILFPVPALVYFFFFFLIESREGVTSIRDISISFCFVCEFCE